MQGKKASWVQGIDSIRFFLALVVLLSHLENPFAHLLKSSDNLFYHYTGVFVNHLFCGAAAVTVFFVISGFVIHYPNRNKDKINVGQFLLRRWLRISLPLAVVSAFALHYHIFGLLPVWSLYCELIYYTIYPVLFRINTSWQNKVLGGYAVSVVFILLFMADRYFGHLPGSHLHFAGALWYLGIAVVSLPCWLLGVLLAERINTIQYSIGIGRIWLYRVLIYLISMCFLALRMHRHIYFTYSLVFFALIVYKWLEAEIIYYRHHPVSPFTEYLGKFSYSLYLTHIVSLFFIAKWLQDSTSTYLVIILITIVVSYLFYLVIENPAHQLARWFGKKMTMES